MKDGLRVETKLTCVTAVLNAIRAGNRDRLIRCVESVAALRIPHEYLIYDGMSTDGTVALLRELEARTPDLRVISEPDMGIYNALNKGVRDARGGWLYVLGCDDAIMDPAVLCGLLNSDMARALEMIASPVFLSEDGACQLKVCRPRLLCGVPYPHQGLLMRTNLVRRLGGFDESYRIAGDYALILRAVMANAKVGFNDVPFAYYSTGGLSSNQERCYAEFERVISSALQISLNEARHARMRAPRSMNYIFRCLRHRSDEVRCSARYLLFRYVIGKLGLLNEAGALRWRSFGF